MSYRLPLRFSWIFAIGGVVKRMKKKEEKKGRFEHSWVTRTRTKRRLTFKTTFRMFWFVCLFLLYPLIFPTRGYERVSHSLVGL